MHSSLRGVTRKRMADDREILRGIWEGKIPVSFQLSSDEVHTLNVPEPFYLMVPRLLYFPLVTDKVRITTLRNFLLLCYSIVKQL